MACADASRAVPASSSWRATLAPPGGRRWRAVPCRGRGEPTLLLHRTEQDVGQLGAGARHAAEAGEICMPAPEMTRRLVLLGVADCAQRAMRLDRHRAQRRTGKRNGRRGKNAPLRIVSVAFDGRSLKRKPCAVEADQAVGELVLHRLEL